MPNRTRLTPTKTLSSSHQSSTTNPKHRRRKPENDPYNDSSDYSEFSRSQSPDDNDLDQSMKSYDSYNASDSVINEISDQFSSKAPESVSEGIDFNTKPSILNSSASNTPNCSRPNSQTDSYMNIAPFPIFHGASNECPVAHLSRFAKVCRANNVKSIDMMMKIFPVTLDSEASLWFDLNIEPYFSSLTWEEIQSSFLQAYNRIDLTEQLRTELMMINQGEEESIRSYFLRLQWILNRWPEHGLIDNLLKGIFIDGLREEFQNWIIPQKPNCLNEAMRLAFSYEQVKSVRDGRKKLVVKCGFCDGLHEEKSCDIKERMREMWLNGQMEKELMIQKSGNSEAEKDGLELERSASMCNKSNEVREEGGKEKDREVVRLKRNKSICQCEKHQCWKKKLDRNTSSMLSSKSNNAD